MSNSSIKQLIALGESEHIEFKEQLDFAQVARAVCAFLNSDGGTVVLGVDDRGKIAGIRDVTVRSAALGLKLREALTPQAPISVSVEATPEGDLIRLDVPAGSEKPYVIDGSIFFRRGNAIVPATASEIRQLISKRLLAEQRWERRPVLGLDVHDLDEQEILRTAKQAAESGRIDFREISNVEAILEDLSLTFQGCHTNAALVLFGKNPARIFPQTRLRLTVFEAGKGGQKLLRDDLAEGHIFSLFKAAVDFLKGAVGVTSTFDPDSHTCREYLKAASQADNPFEPDS